MKIYYKNGKRIIRVRKDHLFTVFCFGIAIIILSSVTNLYEYTIKNHSVFDVGYWILIISTAIIIVAALLMLFSGVMGMHLAISFSTTEKEVKKEADDNENSDKQKYK